MIRLERLQTHLATSLSLSLSLVSRQEPFAYWPLDAKMLNKRKSKALDASVGLKSVLKASGNPQQQQQQQQMAKRSLDSSIAKPVRTKIPRAQRKAQQKKMTKKKQRVN